jgi:general secretion pathway protein A
MYTSFFGLNEKPFAITPDPRYLYMSERHAEALAHLMYGISEAGGFVQLTGEVGTGKTTVVRSLLGQIPQNTDLAVILNPRQTPAEFLLTICEELHVPVPEQGRNSTKTLVDRLSHHLLEAHARGRRVVLIVDEAQNLSFELLEQVRLLTNLETPTQKLLQIILIGQPELREVLNRVELRQLAQRITGRYHLNPLSRGETAAYVRHRLRVAGATAELFTNGALREIHRLTRGIPRVINVICDRCLLGAYTQDLHLINGATVRRAAREVYGRPVLPLWTRWAVGGAMAAGVVLFALGIWQVGGQRMLGWLDSNAEPARIETGAADKQMEAAEASAQAAADPAAEPPAAAPAAGPMLEDLLQADSTEDGLNAAFARLFALWDASYQPGGIDPCALAAGQGLECMYQRGSWAQIRALNRPAILTLADRSGTEHSLLLTGLDDERVTVHHGGQSHDLGLTDVSQYWYGDFLVLWRPQVTGATPLSVGMQGEAVRWLRDSLRQARKLSSAQPADASGAEPTGPPDMFDWELVRQVENFQRDHRLTVDGIAGRQTQLVLDSVLSPPGAPVLASPARGG